MIDRRLALLSALLLGLASQRAVAEEPALGVRWKLQSNGLWPPALSGDRLVVKTGDTVTAYSVGSGRLLWTQRLDDLRLGEGTMAVGERYLYLLDRAGLEILDLRDGQRVGKRALSEASAVLYQGGSVYVAGQAGLLRLDEKGTSLLQKAPGLQGELRGADGDYVAIYRQLPRSPKESPKRLTVANLRTGKVAFEFKLFPSGTHRVARMADGRIVFIDYTQAASNGRGDGKRGSAKRPPTDPSNPRKLYYTEADYIRGKKLRDVSLAAKYTSETADSFWLSASSSGQVFLANHGKPGDTSTLFAFDPEREQTIWTRSGDVASAGLVLHEGRLWTTVAGKGGAAQLLGYSPETGDVVSRVSLDAPGTGSPVPAGQALLVRTRGSIYCVAPQGGPPRAGLVGRLGNPRDRSGWRAFRDRVAGYLIQIPETWKFNRDGMRKLGGLRFVIPFVRAESGSGQAVKQGTVHVLTWEAAGRDAQGLWRSVQAQRLRTNPRTRVQSVVSTQSGGLPAVLATYVYRSTAGEPVQMRSLCVVSHGVAFELRAWVSSTAPVEAWQEVEGIFRSFQPKPPGSL